MQANHEIIDPLIAIPTRGFAIIAIACFAPVVATFVVAPGVWWADYPGIFFHLAMFMLVSRLDAPDWAKAAGYGWLMIDVTTAVLTLNLVPHSIADFVRLGGHVFAGIWIATASLSGSRPIKMVGVIAGVWLAGYSFVSPFLPAIYTAPTAFLWLAWLALIAWQNGSRAKTRDIAQS